MGFPSAAAAIRPGVFPSLHVSRNKGHDVGKASTTRAPINTSYPIMQCKWPLGLYWHIWNLFQPIPSSLVLDNRLIHHWALPPPTLTAIFGWTSSCLVDMQMRLLQWQSLESCIKLCQAVPCSEIAMNAIFKWGTLQLQCIEIHICNTHLITSVSTVKADAPSPNLWYLNGYPGMITTQIRCKMIKIELPLPWQIIAVWHTFRLASQVHLNIATHQTHTGQWRIEKVMQNNTMHPGLFRSKPTTKKNTRYHMVKLQ